MDTNSLFTDQLNRQTGDSFRQIILAHCHMAFTGFLIGLFASSLIAVLRLAVSATLNLVMFWTAPDHQNILTIGCWCAFAIAAALATGWLARNPAIRFGGASWIMSSIQSGQPHVFRTILLPKFISTWLVLGSGVSVGSEGPSIQLGAAAALGMSKIKAQPALERRFYILAGCAAGLGGAFSAPFSGLCYVYEVMSEKMSKQLFAFLMAGSIGIYIGCTQIFGLGVMLPITGSTMPGLKSLWLLLPLGLFSGLVGIAYNYLLRLSKRIYSRQHAIPSLFQPLLSFGITAIIVPVFPLLSGGGFDIFHPIEAGSTTLTFLCIFLIAKLLLTAYCYGSAIPAGIMVPVICLGGVSGSIYADWLALLGHMEPGLYQACIVMGMAGAFSAAECAPVTAMVLIAEMTGSWQVCMGLLFTAAIAYVLARLAKVQHV